MDTFKRPSEGLRELALFAGAGGGILGGQLLGWRTVCAVENDPHARAVLCARQNDGCLEPFPIWSNVLDFDGRPWRGRVDVVSGGFPCVDISCAGKGAGIEGEHSGLWREMARIVGEVRPRFVWVENSPMLVHRGLGLVLADLAKLGYDARWGVVSAADAGMAHLRKRLWIVGYSVGTRLEGHARHEQVQGEGTQQGGPVGEASLRFAGWKPVVYSADCDEWGNCPECGIEYSECNCIGPTMDAVDYIERNGVMWGRKRIWFTEPELGRVAHGIPSRVDRLERIGNGQCPQAMALAWNVLTGGVK